MRSLAASDIARLSKPTRGLALGLVLDFGSVDCLTVVATSEESSF